MNAGMPKATPRTTLAVLRDAAEPHQVLHAGRHLTPVARDHILGHLHQGAGLDRKKPVGRMISSTSASEAVARSWTDTLTFAGGC
jgi:hypothetical protein